MYNDRVNTIEKNVQDEDKSEKKIKTNEKSLLFKLGNVSEKNISILASLAVALMIIEPAFIAVWSLFNRNVDYYLLFSWNIVRFWIFPIVSVIAFILYILIILKIRNDNKGLLYHLKKNPIFCVFSIAVILMLISQFYNGMQSTLDKAPDYVRGESFDLQYSYFIFVLFTASQVRVAGHKRIVVRLMLVGSIIISIVGFVLWKTEEMSVLFENWKVTFKSIFVNTNYYGYYLAIVVPLAGVLFVREKKVGWKIFYGLSFIINVIALSLNNSTGAWIGALFGLIFIIITHIIVEKKINIQTLLLIPVFILCIYIPGNIAGTFNENILTFGSDIGNIISGDKAAESAGSGRWIIWTTSMDIIKINRWFGIGFEGVVMRHYAGPPYMSRPHNEFMQYALFYGVPMALMYIVGCLGIYIRALRKKKVLDGLTLACLSAAFGYLVSSFFGLTVFNTAMYLFIFLGMGYVREKTSENNNAESVAVDVTALGEKI